MMDVFQLERANKVDVRQKNNEASDVGKIRDFHRSTG
jgi:hypothetical protein